MHSDRMRTDAISQSMIYTSPILSCSVIVVQPFLIYQDRICTCIYYIDYNENSTAQYMF